MEYRTYEDMNTQCNELQTMRDAIELMPKFNQVEILRILTKSSNVTINENKYGIHINLTDLNQSLIEELKIYIRYVKSQEQQLDQTEKQKESFKNTYFMKDVKDK
jgi:hypothetical protein